MQTRQAIGPAFRFAAMLLAFLCLIELGIHIYQVSGELTTVRPVCGVALALLLMKRGGSEWSVALALCLAEMGLRSWHGMHVVDILVAAATTVSSVFVTWLVVRMAIGPMVQFRNWRHLLAFALIGAGVATLSASLFAACLTLLYHNADFWKNWLEWFIPTTLSYALFTPLTVLAFTANFAIFRSSIAGFVVSLLVLMGALVSLYIPLPIPRMSVIPLILVVIALKFEIEGLALALLATEAFMTAAILTGHSLTAMESLSAASQLQFSQIYIVSLALGLLPSAAAITERREFRDSLARAVEKNNLLSRIVESSEDAITSRTLDGTIESCNRAAARMYGYAPDELVGQNVSVLIPDTQMEDRDRIMAELRQGKTIQNFETVRRRKDGSEFSASLSISPIRDSSGKVIGASTIARDITERRRRDAKLAALSEELSHLARAGAMGQMSGAIAHELGQPLAAITNYASTAEYCLNKDAVAAADVEAARDAIARAGAAAVRAGTIIRGLRAFIEKRPSRPKYDDLNAILQEAIAMTFLGAMGNRVQLRLQVAAAVLPVMVDRVQVQQVMYNLMRNAIEAMENSPIQEMVIFTGLEERGFAFFEILDTGPGIADAVLAKLFEPFKTTKAEGMGLGLSICKTIIEAHKGTIQVANCPPGGARFHVRIPLAPAA